MSEHDERRLSENDIRFEQSGSDSRSRLLAVYPELAGLSEDLMKIVVTLYENVDVLEKSLLETQGKGRSESQPAAYAFIRFTLNVVLKKAENPLLEKFIRDYNAKIDRLLMESEIPLSLSEQ